ncbi:MAG: HAMP domain-containing histidine kinase [Deltaproteobacteria bacterium]|nr:HAMP domain-containing histidine kinase [Deltaproteobacteria bacterium]
MVRHRLDEAVRSRLAAVDGQVVRVVERWDREFARVADGIVAADSAAVRETVRRSRGVRQVFVLDPAGRMVHPPPAGPRTPPEDEFIERTRAIWERRETFARPRDGGGTGEQGWHAWYWGSGLNLIWWRRDEAGRVTGVEVDRVALLADVLGELPATDPDNPATPDGRIDLVDANGAVLYTWGRREPADSDPSPTVSRDLSPPLASWRLDHHPAPGEAEDALGGGLLVGALSGVGALAFVLAAVAAWLVRESGRAAREAEARVTFVNQVSHELKTPLTNIRMYAELLEERLEDEDEATRGYVGVITSESRRLSRLIGNVLSFARQGRGRLAIRPAPGRVDDVIAGVIGQFRPALRARGVEVTASGGAPAEVMVDGDALGQVVGNLLSNVEKYGASGGVAEVSTRQDGRTTTVEVADRGPGIPASQREKVFEPFHRLSSRVADGVTGTGIGLSISRDLARLHGGDLTVVPCDAGARFRLVIDTPPAPGGAA